MRISEELQVGKAGEYLVCADLILKGFVAFPSEQGLPYNENEKISRVYNMDCLEFLKEVPDNFLSFAFAILHMV